MDYDSLMKVENLGDKIEIFAWDGQRFTVKPGSTALVSFDALVSRLGDPRSAPQISRVQVTPGGPSISIPSRQSEINRLNTLYGIYTEGVNDPSIVQGSEGVTLLERMPKVVVTNIEDDEPVVFPCDDPDCSRFVPQDTDKSQVAATQRQIEAMRRKMIVMEQMVKAATGQSASEALGDGIEVTEDTPQPSRRITKAG